MITENDLQISNQSYTNKDFESIYTELLDLCKKISNKFDPSSSNESDPFVVLLKLMGFIGDKINYNVDKNTLERFITSATQESSMSELCDMLGYYRHYYKAASVDVTFTSSSAVSSELTIDKYQVVNDGTDDSVDFVTCEDAKILMNSKVSSSKVRALQGTLKDLTILDSTNITLDNLDEDNRIYFSESNVAENGIFFNDVLSYSDDSVDDTSSSSNSNAWKRSTNLNLEINGTNVFKFGYDSVKQLPYLEFPTWISEIWGSSQSIKYIVTNGVNGTISSGTLNSTITKSVDDIEYTITASNVSSSVSGKDPETIDESYSGFKKTIGTFDTLVSCRDYANYIYNMMYDDGTPVVSNVHVEDRRTDLNYGGKVLTYDKYGTHFTPYSTLQSTQKITNSDLCIYPLKPTTDTLFNGVNAIKNYNTTFTPYLSNNQVDSVITNELEDSKTISQNYKEFDDDDVVLLKNKLALNATIATTSKVNYSERQSILSNVSSALKQSFNAREVDFGEEIPFDSILNCIKNSDSRISNVSMYEPTLSTYYVTASGSEFKLESNSDTMKNIVAKNILAGTVPLYKYEDDFNIDWNQSGGVISDNVISVSTKANIKASSLNSGYTLLQNEVIQLLAPNYISKVQYVYGVSYILGLKSDSSVVESNFKYQLSSIGNSELTNASFNEIKEKLSKCDYLITYRTDTNQQIITTIYYNYTNNGTIMGREIKFTNGKYTSQSEDIYGGIILYPNFDMNTNANDSDKEIDGVKYKFNYLGTSDTLDIQCINQLLITNSCYVGFILKDTTKEITQVLLDDEEYMFVVSEDEKTLNVYSSGTSIKLPNNFSLSNYVMSVSDIDISDILNNGVFALIDGGYVSLYQASSENSILIKENQIITLLEGDKIQGNITTNDTIPNNEFKPVSDIASNVNYTLASDGIVTQLSDSNITDGEWQWRALVDINVSKDNPQKVVGEQKIVFTQQNDNDIDTIDISYGQYFVLNNSYSFGGGNDVSLGISTLENDEIVVKYPRLYRYTVSNDTSKIEARSDGTYLCKLKSSGDGTYEFTLNCSRLDGITHKFMIYGDAVDSNSLLSISGVDTTTISDANMHILTIKDGVTKIVISSNKEQSIVISKLASIVGENPNLGVTFDSGDSMENYLSTKFKEAYNVFYSLSYDDSVNYNKMDISSEYTLTSPYSLYDKKNVANQWVISQIDFGSGYNVTIAQSSRSN